MKKVACIVHEYESEGYLMTVLKTAKSWIELWLKPTYRLYMKACSGMFFNTRVMLA